MSIGFVQGGAPFEKRIPTPPKWTKLACIIHESRRFVNKHLEENCLVLFTGFDTVLCTLLKASPERRPAKAAVEARRADRS
jgi:hypothetical protein